MQRIPTRNIFFFLPQPCSHEPCYRLLKHLKAYMEIEYFDLMLETKFVIIFSQNNRNKNDDT